MASKSVNIPDMWLALQGPNSVVPGFFDEAGTMFIFPLVESTNSKGRHKFWEIRVRVRSPEGEFVPFNSQEWLGQPVTQPPDHVGVITTDSWQEGGDPRAGGVETVVLSGKNLGKKNATNVATQAIRDALSRYNKHVKSTGSGAASGKLRGAATTYTESWRPPPMLVKKEGEVKATRLSDSLVADGLTVQRKFNGIRMVACLAPDVSPDEAAEIDASDPSRSGVVLYSRTSGLYHGKLTLRAALKPMFDCFPEVWAKFCESKGRDPWQTILHRSKIDVSARSSAPPLYIDGELYEHGSNLQWIQGQGCGTSSGDELSLMVFDCFFPHMANHDMLVSSATRQALLQLLFTACGGSSQVQLAETFPISKSLSADAADLQIRALAKKFLAEKYEGAIVRKDGGTYQYGINNYHSAHLFKIKPRPDAEYPVVGFTQGVKGKDVGAIIWICTVPPERSLTGEFENFNVVPKNMSYDVRRELFRRLQLTARALPAEIRDRLGAEHQDRDPTLFELFFRGKPMTVEYPELSSKTGIPVQAKALGFRVREPTPENPGGSADPAQFVLRLNI